VLDQTYLVYIEANTQSIMTSNASFIAVFCRAYCFSDVQVMLRSGELDEYLAHTVGLGFLIEDALLFLTHGIRLKNFHSRLTPQYEEWLVKCLDL
jgi:hypothetical protein